MRLTVMCSVFLAVPAFAEELSVPGDYSTIQSAIDAAADGDIINVGPGAYSESLDLSGKSLEIVGTSGYQQTILNNNGAPSPKISVPEGESTVRVAGFSIINGVGASMTSVLGGQVTFEGCRWSGGQHDRGAAVFANNADLEFNDCRFLNCVVTQEGGAIHATDSNLDFTDCFFTSNRCTGTGGGAIWQLGGTLDLTRSEFSSNLCDGGTRSAGGSIYLTNVSGGEWEGCKFVDSRCVTAVERSVSEGGDAFFENSFVKIQNSTFENSQAWSSDNDDPNNSFWSIISRGGSLRVFASSPQLISCTFRFANTYAFAESNDNCCATERSYSLSTGGAISADLGSSIFATNSVFDSCVSEAGSGAAGAFARADRCSRGGAIDFKNSTGFYDNCQFMDCDAFGSGVINWNSDACVSYSNGGALYFGDLSSPNFLNCTFTNCDAYQGGAAHLQDRSSPYFTNCTFTSNTASNDGGAVYALDSSPSIGGGLFQDNAASVGGAIRVLGDQGIAVIADTTFCGNTVDDIAGDWFDDGGNQFPIDCGGDCDGDGQLDIVQIAIDPTLDCDEDGGLDACAIAGNPAIDCDENGVLDSCEVGGEDCDGNGIADSCEPDCDENGFPDPCELLDGFATDCDLNGVIDACDLDGGAADCNTNGILDVCEADCDGDFVPDDCEIADGAEDCDGNGVPDVCDAADGALTDINNDGIFDACQTLDYSGLVTEILPIQSRSGVPVMPATAVRYRVYATFADASASVISMYGDPARPMVVEVPGGFYQHPQGGNLADTVTCFVPGQPLQAYDSWFTFTEVCSQGQDVQSVGVNFTPFNAGDGLNVDDGLLYMLPGSPETVAGSDGRVLLMQLTVNVGTAEDGSPVLPQIRLNLAGNNADGSDWQGFEQLAPAPELLDCNANGIHDAYDIANASSLDCDVDGIPDECIWADPEADCDGNGVPDLCDIRDGSQVDQNQNGIPDDCECLGDVTGDGTVNVLDIVAVILAWGEPGGPADLDFDGDVGLSDLLLVIEQYASCPG